MSKIISETEYLVSKNETLQLELKARLIEISQLKSNIETLHESAIEAYNYMTGKRDVGYVDVIDSLRAAIRTTGGKLDE